MRIIHIASPKNRIIQYGISDPFIKSLVYKNENLIAWDQIPPLKVFKKNNQKPECEKLINEYINKVLIPKTYSKIKERGSHYVKDIDIPERYRDNPYNPQIEKLYRLYKVNPQKAKQNALIEINEPKKEAFEEWWTYINDQYKEYPAFIYMLLNPIFDTSKSNSENPPVPLKADAVAGVFEKIKGGNFETNILKEYGMETSKSEKFVSGDFENGWVHIPSKTRSDQNPNQYGSFEDNLAILRKYGKGGGWCVGGASWSTRHLTTGDFYIYSEAGSPKVAIRTEGPVKVAEVKGRHNRPENLIPHWEASINFINEKELDASDCYDFKAIKEISELNESIRETNPESIKAIQEQIKEDPDIYNKLSKENKAIDAISSTSRESWETAVKSAPQKYGDVPAEFKSDELREYAIYHYNNEFIKDTSRLRPLYEGMPKELDPFIYPENMARIEETYLKSIRSDISQSTHFPKEILESPVINKKIKLLWEHALAQSPWKIGEVPLEISKNFSEEFLSGLRESMVSEVLEELAEADYSSESIGLNPDEIVDQFQDEYEEELKLLILQETKDELSQSDEEEDIERLRELEENGVEAIDLESIYEDKSEINLRSIPEVQEYVIEAWKTYVNENVEMAHHEMENYRNDYYEKDDNVYDFPLYNDSIQSELHMAWSNYLYENPTRVYDIPEDVRSYLVEADDMDGKTDLTRAWESFLPANPDKFDEIEPEYLMDIDEAILLNAFESYYLSSGLPDNLIEYLSQTFEVGRTLDQNAKIFFYKIFNIISESDKEELLDMGIGLTSEIQEGRDRQRDKLLQDQGQQEFNFNAQQDQESQEEVQERNASRLIWYKVARLLE